MSNLDPACLQTVLSYYDTDTIFVDDVLLRNVLTPTQYKYYADYYYKRMLLCDISLKYDVSISTVCRTIKRAVKRLNNYYIECQKG